MLRVSSLVVPSGILLLLLLLLSPFSSEWTCSGFAPPLRPRRTTTTTTSSSETTTTKATKWRRRRQRRPRDNAFSSSCFVASNPNYGNDYDDVNKKNATIATSMIPSFSSTSTSSNTNSNSGGGRLSPAAAWHKERRKQMITKYPEILDLEKESSQNVGIPLLMLGNLTLFILSIMCGSLPWYAVVGLAIFPGSILSLWQLQILHDALHGTLLEKTTSQFLSTKFNMTRKELQDNMLFWGSMPSIFGYYLYLQYGHLTHHKNVGGPEATLERLFDSNQVDFEDGDVLFVSHRMNLKGGIGPQFPLPSWLSNVFKKDVITMSISRSGFGLWRTGHSVWNACMFAFSFLFERFMLMINDGVVALTGRNYFFPHKPDAFHQQCTTYARVAVLVRLSLFFLAGSSWKAILFLYLSETLWSIPPHPACAMFVTNHGSSDDMSNNNSNNDNPLEESSSSSSCAPSSSTYAGRWYSIMTLGTNFHCEHHDFPSIPFHRLWKLRQIAPEYYYNDNTGNNKSLLQIMDKAFGYPDFYACSDFSTMNE